MIYEVAITDQADADLTDNAAGQLDRLEKHIIGLKDFPEKFKSYEKSHGAAED